MTGPHSRIAILASGNGSNAEAIIRYFTGRPDIAVALVLSNRADAGVLARAKELGVESKVFDKKQFQDGTVLEWLETAGVTHLVLAGFIWLITQQLLQAFPGRIINIHPSLLPKFGGKGMYGRNVHEAVLAAGEKATGITIHLLNEHFDEGEIVFQATCDLSPGDLVESISRKVNALEHEHYPRVIEGWIKTSR